MKLLQTVVLVLMIFLGAIGVNCVNAEGGCIMENKYVDNETIADIELKSKVKDELKNLTEFVEIIVQEGTVLVVGSVPTEAERAAIVKTIKAVNGCKKVVDEIKIQKKPTMADDIADTARTAEMKALLFVPNNGVPAMNYRVLTVRGIVYVLGVANSDKEKEKVIEIAKRSSKQGEVITHIVVRK